MWKIFPDTFRFFLCLLPMFAAEVQAGPGCADPLVHSLSGAIFDYHPKHAVRIPDIRSHRRERGLAHLTLLKLRHGQVVGQPKDEELVIFTPPYSPERETEAKGFIRARLDVILQEIGDVHGCQWEGATNPNTIRSRIDTCLAEWDRVEGKDFARKMGLFSIGTGLILAPFAPPWAAAGVTAGGLYFVYRNYSKQRERNLDPQWIAEREAILAFFNAIRSNVTAHKEGKPELRTLLDSQEMWLTARNRGFGLDIGLFFGPDGEPRLVMTRTKPRLDLQFEKGLEEPIAPSSLTFSFK
jgi:hypothetical protein